MTCACIGIETTNAHEDDTQMKTFHIKQQTVKSLLIVTTNNPWLMTILYWSCFTIDILYTPQVKKNHVICDNASKRGPIWIYTFVFRYELKNKLQVYITHSHKSIHYFFCRRTYSLELTAWWSAWSNCELRTISAEPEDIPVHLTFEALAH